MGKATPHARAVGAAGPGAVAKIEAAGLEINEAGTRARLCELEKQNRLLRDIASDSAELNVVAAQVLREAMSK